MKILVGFLCLLFLITNCSDSTELETGSNSPSNLVVTVIWSIEYTNWVLNLTWDAPENPDEDNFVYRIYKDNQLIATMSNALTNYVDNECEIGSDYSYYVTSFYSDNESDPSNTIQSVVELNTGVVTDIDGNEYLTLIIANQEWMIENLKVTHYKNGDPIQNLEDYDDWINTNEGAYCFYNNDPANAVIYGNLYNWFAVNDQRGLAPEGWRVPSDVDIMELEQVIGMSYDEAHSFDWRGTNEGSKLAGGHEYWQQGQLVQDSDFGLCSFNFLPSGVRYESQDDWGYYSINQNSCIWTSTEQSNEEVYIRIIAYQTSRINRKDMEKESGFSVRCIRDVE